ncbi:hypothetical protein K8Z61_01015 [Nocardioides sp. TRM66260-LWL]|uniref:hypothetical protein n=1 Tax=Nocardioides sp. TRM66260-LWL TaxID=2874478 RepID=UPI001CC5D8E7|nr:hypothetical protein [Nocardioides sp. TRM66260-LWL]MBZ5733063.1 hypothetical protein [Nocardioides sp. TRM66260-LWL]
MPTRTPEPAPRPRALLRPLGVGLAAVVLGVGAYLVTDAVRADDASSPGVSPAAAEAAPTSSASPSKPPADAVTAPDAAVTAFPGLAAATGDPVLPGTADAAPSTPGGVGRIAGPFDDRFAWQRLRLADGVVTGGLDVTSDVSDLLELQVQAAFYDRSGRLLGVGRFTHHLDESTHQDDGPPSELERFRIAAPASYRAKVASAAVGVPVLVNE